MKAYQLHCPAFPQWKFRGNGLCNNSWKYSCLFNTNEYKYNENCGYGLHFLGAGYKFVISGMLDRRQCGAERFQPFKLSSNMSSNCATLKSQCNGEGQIVFSSGTTTHDRSCRCNYIDNFVFVTKPKETCYCLPSQEDCSCYYKPCAVDHYLTPDYQCIHFSNWTGIFECPIIQKEKKPKSVMPTETILRTESIQDSSNYFHQWILTSVILVFFSFLGLLIFYKKYENLRDIANRLLIFYKKYENLRDIANHQSTLQNTVTETENNLRNMKRRLLLTKDQSTLQNTITETENNLRNMKRRLLLTKGVLSMPEQQKTHSTLVETRPFQLLKQHIVEKDYFVVVGVSGSGKSVILYQLADEMYNKEGYQIVTANKPSEVLERNNEYQKQLFVFDDVCGKCTFDPTLADSWNMLATRIQKILKERKTKMLFSCTSHISKEKKFQAVSILAENTCDIQSSEFSMTREDNYQIARNCLNKNDVDRLETADDFNTSNCVPLLCNLYSSVKTEKTDVLEFFSDVNKALADEIRVIAKHQTCNTCFFFFVIYNNALSENFVKDNQSIMNKIGDRKLTSEEVIGVIQDYHVFVKKSNGTFFVCHDMVFDILVSFVSQCRLDEVLEFACADILCERCHFESIGVEPNYGCIKIPVDKEDLYFKRLISDVIKLEKCFTFKNRQLKFTSYRKKFINFLIDNLNVIKTIYKSDVSPLLISTFQGFSDVVNVFLTICTDVINMTDEVGRTALYIAAEFNDKHTGTVLLERKCNINISRSDDGHERESPLHIAAFKRNYEFIKLLIMNDVKLDQTNAKEMTALHISCTKEDEKSVELLLDYSADPNIPNTKNNTPLHTAVDIGNAIIVKFLINHKANLQMRNKDGESPLYIAASKGHSAIVKLLLQADPKIIKVNDTSMSPLYLAAREGFYETVKLLLEYGADPNSCVLLNKSPLYVASESGHVKIVEHLLETNADPNVCTYGGFTPLYVSSLKGHTNIVHLLLKYHADPNISSSKNLSPLFEACLKGYSDIVKLLLEKDADVCFSDRNKRSPLYIASREGHFDIVKLLLDKGANLNQATVVKRTPLYAATLEGHPEIVKYLLHKNADLNISTVDSLTPLIVAKQEGHIDIVKILNSFLEQESCEIFGT